MPQVEAKRLEAETELEADVAVVGAGPAGIVLGLELAEAGHSVLLIESGGDSFDPEIQHLGDAIRGDSVHVPMSLATRRQIGGASNIWGGRCVPFDPIDFEKRSVAGDVTWPVAYDELDGLFSRACEWCVCGKAVFDARDDPRLSRRSLVPGWPDQEVRATSLERWSLPTNFGKQYRRALKSTPQLTLVTGMTVTEVVPSEGGSVSHLVAKDRDQRRFKIKAKRHVLAAGGLESTRLLLSSDAHRPGGIGNHSGHLGRWYMAHVESRIARVRFSTPPDQTIYAHERDADGVYVRRRFSFSPEFQREQQLPNNVFWLVNPEIGNPGHGSGVLSFVYLMLISPLGRHFVSDGIREAHTKTKGSVRAHLANVVRSLPSTVWFALSFGYNRFLRRGRKVPGFFVKSAANVYPLLYHGEHFPRRESKVELAAEQDELGMPRLRTELRFSDEDVAAVLHAHERFDQYLREHGLGELEYIYDDPDAAVRDQHFGGYHQSGTTRMSSRPEDGVVDANLAVHGFSDLYVLSSSTFVTSSQANSTFMVIVFALRLAEHLDRSLRSRQDFEPAASS